MEQSRKHRIHKGLQGKKLQEMHNVTSLHQDRHRKRD